MLSRSVTREATRIYQFITNNRVSFHLWWKKNLVKLKTFSKYYDHGCSIPIKLKLGEVISIEEQHGVKREKSDSIRSYSGPHFPAFGLNMERYSVSLRNQSECGKMRTRITPNTDNLYAVCILRKRPFCMTNASFHKWVST